MKKTKVITITMILMVTILLTISPIVKAINPDDYDPTKQKSTIGMTLDIVGVKTSAGPVINAIAVTGIVVSVIALMIIGIKYMVGSIEEKAEYKKKMIPYIIGVFMIVGTTQLLNIIYKIVTIVTTEQIT